MDIKEKRKALSDYCDDMKACRECPVHGAYYCEFDEAPEEMIEKWYAIAFPETVTPEKMTRQKILETAVKMVCGHREQDYGKPENNFQCIADLWTAYLYHNTNPDFGVSVSAADVAALMILFKVGRLATGAGSADTWVDIAGYAACGGEIATERGADNA